MDDSMDGGTKRIDALKSAANNFVNHIAEQNQGISDSSKQHQVSIVKFSGDKSAAVGNDTYYRGGYKYNYSQVMKAMSPCTDAAAFRNTINSINPAGSTRADYSLPIAKLLTAKMPRRSLSSSPTVRLLLLADSSRRLPAARYPQRKP